MINDIETICSVISLVNEMLSRSRYFHLRILTYSILSVQTLLKFLWDSLLLVVNNLRRLRLGVRVSLALFQNILNVVSN